MSTYAGFWKRAGAFALDYLIILVYLLVLALIGWLINSLSSAVSWLFADRFRAQLSGFLLVTLPVTLYFALSESSARRATWGKKKLGLQVTDYNGARISGWRSLGRTTLKFIPWEISHTIVWAIAFSAGKNPAWINYGLILVYALIGLNLLCLLFTRKHQTMYDLIAKTYVIKRS
jgi:uncharacterized RDD family membrane protein YckC